MTFKTRLSVLLVSTPVLAFVVIGGMMGNASARTGEDFYRHLGLLFEVVGLVENNYVEAVNVDKVMEGAFRGLAEGLDPDSAYLNPQQVREVESGGVPEGDLGIELTRQFYLRIIAARDDSPAASAGLQTGDYVRAIDGKSTRDLSVFEGSRLLRGAPGSKVVLTIIRGNAADPHELTLVREKRSVPQVSARMLGEGAGYLRIPAFSPTTSDEVRRHAADLEKSGAKAILIDLRRTAEGNFDPAIATARLFVGAGTITATGGRPSEGEKEPVKAPVTAGPGDGVIKLPVQILVSAGTSGAAEVFAAALDGNNRADLIGEHTIGRAATQKLVKLPEKRALWLTTTRYYTPGGELIHGAGLKPDVPFDEPDVEFGAKLPASDPMLDAALQRVKDGNLMVPRQPKRP